jgi:hypothetical protein
MAYGLIRDIKGCRAIIINFGRLLTHPLRKVMTVI